MASSLSPFFEPPSVSDVGMLVDNVPVLMDEVSRLATDRAGPGDGCLVSDLVFPRNDDPPSFWIEVKYRSSKIVGSRRYLAGETLAPMALDSDRRLDWHSFDLCNFAAARMEVILFFVVLGSDALVRHVGVLRRQKLDSTPIELSEKDHPFPHIGLVLDGRSTLEDLHLDSDPHFNSYDEKLLLLCYSRPKQPEVAVNDDRVKFKPYWFAYTSA